MSAYQFPAATPSYPATASADPTAVIGRRIGGWVVDFLLYSLIMAFFAPTPLSPLAEYYDTDEQPGISCEDVQDLNDVSSCLEIGDRLYFTETGDAAIQFVVFVAVVLLYSALQGATGVTPGKAVFGIKVVDEQGRRPGFGKSLLRTVLWVIDLFPWCIPGLLGFITGLTTKGHRRVGDMAAKTFVVGKAHDGPVHVPGLATAATGGYPTGPGGYGAPGQQWGAPPPGAPGSGAWGSQPPSQQQGAWGAPPSGGFPPAGAPGPGGPPPSGAPGSAGTPSGEQRPAPPGAQPTGPTPGAGPVPSPAAGTPSPPGGGPSPVSGAPSPTAGTPAQAGDDDASASPGHRASDDESPWDDGGAPRPTGSAGSTGDDAPGARSFDVGATAAGGPPTAAAPSPGEPAGGTPGAASPTGPSPATGPASQAAPSGYNPQWDAARGTYIVWEPVRGKWLGWDEAAKEWKPL